MAITSAPGKVIFFGEHAVLYGKPAVAGAISARAKANFRERRHYNEIILNQDTGSTRKTDSEKNILFGNFDQEYEEMVDAIKNKSDLSQYVNHWSNPIIMLTSRFEHDNIGYFMSGNYSINIVNRVPKGCGSGSAIAAAVTASMYKQFIGRWDRRTVEDYVNFSDSILHANHNSGLDSQTVVYGNFQIKTKHGGFNHFRLNENFQVLVVDSGVNARTGIQTKKLEELINKDSKAMETIDEIGLLTESGITALKEQDLVKVGELMYENHELLRTLEVSCPELDKIVEIAKKSNAYGAKLTGAGGGGSAIVIAEEISSVRRELILAGFNTNMRHVGVAGLWDESY